MDTILKRACGAAAGLVLGGVLGFVGFAACGALFGESVVLSTCLQAAKFGAVVGFIAGLLFPRAFTAAMDILSFLWPF